MFWCCYGCFIIIAIITTIRKIESTFLFHLFRELLTDTNSCRSGNFFKCGQEVSVERCSRKFHYVEIHTIGLFCSFTSQNKTTETTTTAQDYLKCWFLYWFLKHEWRFSGWCDQGGSTLSLLVYLSRIVAKQRSVTQPVPVPALPSWQYKVRLTKSRKKGHINTGVLCCL